METYGGVYDAVVVDNIDPTGQMRLAVQIPTVFGREIVHDVKPVLPSATGATTPQLGDSIFVMFRNGSAAHPVWVGTTRQLPDPSSGGGSGGTHYSQTFVIASTTWTATHNLGYPPSVTLYDPSGNQIMGQITSNTNTTTTVAFAIPVTGKMTLS